MATQDQDPGKKPGIELHGAVWMTAGGASLGGKGRIGLLAKVAECGSITQAAKAFGMSYKAAWDAIDSMNNLAGEALVARSVGGKGGGGTSLTQRGQQLVANFRILEQEHQRFVEELSKQADGLASDYFLIRRMAMKTSAGNQFQGKITRIKAGAVNDEIELEVTGGQKIVATVSCESTEGLGLCLGMDAFALIPSASIMLVTDDTGAKFSARNRLSGTIDRVKTGAVNTEVLINLPGGGSVLAMVTNDSSERLGLVRGGFAAAIFKASSVVIGVPA